MNIYKTDPTVISNYFRVPTTVKAETRNQKIAKVAAIALTTLATILTAGLSLLITFVAFKISDAREYKGIDRDLLNFPDQEEEDFEGVDLELYHFPNQQDEEPLQSAPSYEADEAWVLDDILYPVGEANSKTDYIATAKRFARELPTTSLALGIITGIALRQIL